MEPEIHNEISEIKDHLSKQDVHSAERGKDIDYIKTTLVRVESIIQQLIVDKNKEHSKIWDEIQPIRDWQIRQGAKIAVWAGIGTSIGGVITALIVWQITK